MRVALVGCSVLPEPDTDFAPLREAIAERGHCVEFLPWDDPDADPASFDLCVLRSTWNYHLTPHAFLGWCRRVSDQTALLNPLDVIRWNHDKTYLGELESRGIPIVPTRWIPRGGRIDLLALAADEGWDSVVLKPCISAASYRTQKFDGDELAKGQRFAEELLAERDMMVQPYMEGFREPGERSLIWIDGVWTHAVVKRPRFAGAHECAERSDDPSAEELSVADAAIAAYAKSLLYARVDLVRDTHGRPVVSEVELIEPSLFFAHAPHSADRFAAAVDRFLHQRRLR